MNRRSYKGLIGLNVALLVVLAAVTIAPGAGAQDDGVERARGDYAMISGRIQATAADAIYVVDRTNQELIAMVFEQGRKRLRGVDFAKLDPRSGGSR
jgi:hypothetical protein